MAALKLKENRVVALGLIACVLATILLIPAAKAHTPAWSIQPYLYISAAPDPVGVGQSTTILAFSTWTLPGADYYDQIRFHDFKLTITLPDGTAEVKTYPVVTDSRGMIILHYTPKETGTYTVLVEYPGQTYIWNQANTQISSTNSFFNYENDTILPASASTTFIVQQDQVAKTPDTPLPTEYWTRPINAQNYLWGSVSSNWLGGAATSSHWQQEGSAPKTPHVMWTKPLEIGGLVGGIVDADDAYYVGFGSEQNRFRNPIVINGMLIYEAPFSNSGVGGGAVALDLRTGDRIWYLPNVAISKGQIFSFQQTPNQHGAVAPLLWEVSGSTWRAYDALTGIGVFNLTNVPEGKEVYAKSPSTNENSGMILRYILTYNATARLGYLALWNNTLAILSQELVANSPGWRPAGKGTIDASQAYSWNVTVTADLAGSQTPTIVGVLPGDLLLGRSSDLALAANWHPMSDPWTVWALNLNASKGPVGSLLWLKTYPAPPGNQTMMFAEQPIDPVNRVFIMTKRETGQRSGFSLDTGELLWETTTQQRAVQYYSNREGFPANGVFYVGGFGGEMFAYSTKDGTLLWKFNGTDSGLNTPWGLYPIHAAAVADGVIYGFSGDYVEANKPIYKDERIHAFNATTGEEIWSLMGWSASGLSTTIEPVAVADGYMAYRNIYDSQIYTLGRGPSATTVTAAPDILMQGSSVLIKGTVMDTASGTKQEEQAARFPSGVAAVSDASMSDWMEYVYMQKSRPVNAKGVEVTLTVLDSNGNNREIGRTTSNIDGFFSYNWVPDIPGTYTLYASFAGSKGYWPSHAVTAFSVEAPIASPSPLSSPITVAEEYFVPIVAGLFVMVLAGFAVITAIILKKRP